jgi:hypothetical protein
MTFPSIAALSIFRARAAVCASRMQTGSLNDFGGTTRLLHRFSIVHMRLSDAIITTKWVPAERLQQLKFQGFRVIFELVRKVVFGR